MKPLLKSFQTTVCKILTDPRSRSSQKRPHKKSAINSFPRPCALSKQCMSDFSQTQLNISEIYFLWVFNPSKGQLVLALQYREISWHPIMFSYKLEVNSPSVNSWQCSFTEAKSFRHADANATEDLRLLFLTENMDIPENCFSCTF